MLRDGDNENLVRATIVQTLQYPGGRFVVRYKREDSDIVHTWVVPDIRPDMQTYYLREIAAALGFGVRTDAVMMTDLRGRELAVRNEHHTTKTGRSFTSVRWFTLSASAKPETASAVLP